MHAGCVPPLIWPRTKLLHDTLGKSRPRSQRYWETQKNEAQYETQEDHRLIKLHSLLHSSKVRQEDEWGHNYVLQSGWRARQEYLQRMYSRASYPRGSKQGTLNSIDFLLQGSKNGQAWKGRPLLTQSRSQLSRLLYTVNAYPNPRQ